MLSFVYLRILEPRPRPPDIVVTKVPNKMSFVNDSFPVFFLEKNSENNATTILLLYEPKTVPVELDYQTKQIEKRQKMLQYALAYNSFTGKTLMLFRPVGFVLQKGLTDIAWLK